MQKSLKLFFISLLVPMLCCPFAQATTNGTAEIQHLFEFISQSNCIFIRNNTEYEAKAARHHMQHKYDYAKRWVDSAEQFIERIATKSSISGKRYEVRCQGQILYSDSWLKQELKRYRSSKSIRQQPAAP